MAWAQWTILGLIMVSLLLNAHLHGEPRDPHNFWPILINAMLTVTLIWLAGGFSKVF